MIKLKLQHFIWYDVNICEAGIFSVNQSSDNNQQKWDSKTISMQKLNKPK